LICDLQLVGQAQESYLLHERVTPFSRLNKSHSKERLVERG